MSYNIETEVDEFGHIISEGNEWRAFVDYWERASDVGYGYLQCEYCYSFYKKSDISCPKCGAPYKNLHY